MGRDVAWRKRPHQRHGDVGARGRSAAQSTTDVGQREGDGPRRAGTLRRPNRRATEPRQVRCNARICSPGDDPPHRRRDPIDTDYRSVVVPDLRVARPTIATPQVFRTRTARGFAELSAEADPAPVASRSFSRTERLLLRVPVDGPEGTEPVLSAILLNRGGDRMRELPVLSEDVASGASSNSTCLFRRSRPANTGVQLTATIPDAAASEVREILTLSVTN